MFRGALIGLLALVLALQGVALRAAPFAAPGAAAPGMELHLCSGGTITLGPDGAPLDPASEPADPHGTSHLGCLDCCLAPIALPEPAAQAPGRSLDSSAVEPLADAPAGDGLAGPSACARDPPSAS
ncbi:hypothetical protein P2H44_11775 [Albimonas sp. CAU 1670]|uniref:hypothetical protein n=1 Tax=Albimonas sp. CAU 1670 TaxID=3032599 RepID=UPI0023DAFDF2|nr:hypothetical protein [Albimonas sp. CAU 1670]MDF2233231.1 hypothetical protein [Albimonas sp. CAU 1670]